MSTTQREPGTASEAREGAGTPGPDFREVARALGLDQSRTLARRAQLLLARLLEDAPRLERALEPLLSSRGGALRICGTTSADATTLSWDESRGREALRAPADFHLESVVRKRRKSYRGDTSFITLSTLSARGELAAMQALLQQLSGADGELLAALRTQFPELYAFLGRIADLDHTSFVRAAPDHVAIRLRAPLDRAAIRAHYPSIDRLHGWINDLVVTITDPAGRVLARIELDGSERVFRLDALARGRDFLWGDGEAPLRDRDGGLVPLGFDLTESQRFQLHAEVTTALFRLGRFRLGSCRLPDSRWELEFCGNEAGDRALWIARLGAIDAPRAPLKWLLPLESVFAALERSFELRIALAPRLVGDAPSSPTGAGLHDLTIDYGLETPRSALLDLAETLLRWGSRSSVFRGLLGVWHDLADSLAADLDALADASPSR